MGPVVLPEKITSAAEKLKTHFQYYPDFPKKGINFWDVFSIFKNRESFNLLNTILEGYATVMQNKVDVVVGIEARGFLLGPILANLLCCTFVPVRKKGKLPGKTLAKTYTVEYGVDTLEIQVDSIKAGQRVIVIDDCLATGGTMDATCQLVREAGGNVVDSVVLYCIPDLSERLEISKSITTLCQ